MRYIKEVFDVTTLDHAKHVVLTSDPKNKNKFEQETEFLINTIKDNCTINNTDTVLDFGCGMGRVSSALVKTFDCNVIGVDISESMRNFALLYVRNPKKFKTVGAYTEPDTVDTCVTVFVLQHVQDPAKEIANLAAVVKTGGNLVVVNEKIRYVPSDVDRNNFIIWNDDKFDIFTEIEKYFQKEKSVPYINSTHEVIFYKKVK